MNDNDLGNSNLRNHRLKQAIGHELRGWLGTMAIALTTTTVLFLAAAGTALYLEAATGPQLMAMAVIATPWFLLVAAMQLGVFLVRAVVMANADSHMEGERRASGVTTLGVALVIAVMIMTFAMARPAAAQTPASAASSEYCERKLGTWFYCTSPTPPPPEEKESPATLQAEKPAEIAELEAFQKQLNLARQVAVWKPTEENVERFYRLQQVALDKGGLFADVYRRLVWTRPDLDYTLKRPVNQLGKQNWEDERSFDRDLFIRHFASELGLFYVFRQNCGACQTFSPIVKAFSDRFAVTVSPISTDGSRNPYFQRTLVDRGQLKSWGVTPQTPAILVYQNPTIDPKTGAQRQLTVRGSSGRDIRLRPCLKPQGCLTYVGAGVMAVDDIAERLYVLLATNPGEDF